MKSHTWTNLTRMQKVVRCCAFASTPRLDLGITIGHIKTILSSHLPIPVDYNCTDEDITGSALWRMRAALRHHDRVRRILFARRGPG